MDDGEGGDLRDAYKGSEINFRLDSLSPGKNYRYIYIHVLGVYACMVIGLTSPEPSEIGHNSFISQPILKPLRPVDSSLASESSHIHVCH